MGVPFIVDNRPGGPGRGALRPSRISARSDAAQFEPQSDRFRHALHRSRLEWCDLPALLAALENLIGRADEVIAAMEGCTDAFDAEAGALMSALRRADAAARSAGGLTDQPDLFGITDQSG